METIVSVVMGVAQLVLTAAGVVFWKHIQEVKDGLSAIRQALTDHRVEVARDYATNHDVAELGRKIDRVIELLGGHRSYGGTD